MHEFFKKYRVIPLTFALILFWTPVLIFAQIADEILEREPIGVDAAILNWLHFISNNFLDIFFFCITTIGNIECLLPITVLIVAYLLYKKQRRNALLVTFGVGGAAAANLVLKYVFQRDRPSLWSQLIIEHGYSFPSGHAMASSALVLCLIVILWNTRWRLVALIGGGIIALLIGVSRLYFGVHYPSDILAGWSVSLVWVFIVVVIVRGLSFLRRPNQVEPKLL